MKLLSGYVFTPYVVVTYEVDWLKPVLVQSGRFHVEEEHAGAAAVVHVFRTVVAT